MSTEKALIFNIQRYSIHDGGGIRTIVFFKGCSLRCPWCCNPESINPYIETGRIESKCIKCRQCSMNSAECPSGAIVDFGRYMTIDEVISEVIKDEIFYRTSGGGVTLSGGEALLEADFCAELLKKLKKLSINTAVETCGQVSTHTMLNTAPFVDEFLFDLKIIDDKKAKAIINADIKLITDNFRALIKNGYNVTPRVPLIPGYTMDEDNLFKITELLKDLEISIVHLLAFHQYGSNKYEFLNRDYTLKELKPPSDEELENCREYFEQRGIKSVMGGL